MFFQKTTTFLAFSILIKLLTFRCFGHSFSTFGRRGLPLGVLDVLLVLYNLSFMVQVASSAEKRCFGLFLSKIHILLLITSKKLGILMF